VRLASFAPLGEVVAVRECFGHPLHLLVEAGHVMADDVVDEPDGLRSPGADRQAGLGQLRGPLLGKSAREQVGPVLRAEQLRAL